MRIYIITGLFNLISLIGFTQRNQYVGIELSPNSVNMTILNIYSKGDGEFYYKIVKDSSVNASFIDFTKESIKDATDKIDGFRNYATQEKNIARENICIAINSGIPIEAKRRNREEIFEYFKKNYQGLTGSITYLDPETESEYAHLSSIIEKFRKDAAMINIDGANTKGGVYVDKDFSLFLPININWGFNSLRNSIPDGNDMPKYNKNIEKSLDKISLEVKEEFDNHKLINFQSQCIIGGDLSRAVSVILFPNSTDLYQEITLAQIKTLKQKIILNYNELFFSGNAQNLDGQKELYRLSEKYDQKTLLVGINYFERIITLLNQSSKSKRFYIARYSSVVACHVINHFFDAIQKKIYVKDKKD